MGRGDRAGRGMAQASPRRRGTIGRGRLDPLADRHRPEAEGQRSERQPTRLTRPRRTSCSKQFLAHAQTVAELPGDHQQEARAAMAELGPDGARKGEPTNFAEAKEAGDEAINKLQGLLSTASGKARDPGGGGVRLATGPGAGRGVPPQSAGPTACGTRNPPRGRQQGPLSADIPLPGRDDYYEAAITGEFVARRQPQSEFAKLCGHFAVSLVPCISGLPPDGERVCPYGS